MASVAEVIARALEAWAPPPVLTLSQWAEANFYLSPESSAERGRWHSVAYQRGIMDALTDPTIEKVSVMKSARVGYTKIITALIGYHIHQDPCGVLLVQPTVDDAKGYSKEEIAPMLRDCPVLTAIVHDDEANDGPKNSGNTILAKSYPGGRLSLVGANSGTGLRRTTRRVVLFDEVDGYPPSAGSEGDQIELGSKRAETFWNRKIVLGSTPTDALTSRIEREFEDGDQRRFHVPCPQCGHMAPLVFSGKSGHVMTWPEDKPEEAFFTCQQNGCVIEHKYKRDMIAAGAWVAAGEFKGHASFHIWAAYSCFPHPTWGEIAQKFVKAKQNVELLKTFVNTFLGETWKERGDAPDWQRLYQRREPYAIGSVPQGVRWLTCGVDVQKDRWVYEVVGWGAGKESWSIDVGVIPGDTANVADWSRLDELLNRSWPSGSEEFPIRIMAVDSGFNTQMVYNWARKYVGRVIAVNGLGTQHTILSSPKAVDVTLGGKRIARGCKLWNVGVDVVKSELYGWLRLEALEAPYPSGFCHFPEYDQEFFKQLTAEHLVTTTTRLGFTKREWQVIPGRQNHWLDARVYARAAAAVLGVDRMKQPKPPVVDKPANLDQTPKPGVAATTPVPAKPSAPPPKPEPRQSRSDSRFRLRGNRGKPWLSK